MICWAIGKFILINIKEENQEFSRDQLDNQFNEWKDLEDNENILLGGPVVYCLPGCWLTKPGKCECPKGGPCA